MLPTSCRCWLVGFLSILFGGALTTDGQQHFFLTGCSFAWLLAFRGLPFVADAAFQCFHQVNNVLALRSRFRGDQRRKGKLTETLCLPPPEVVVE
jgi:hypothetical protein